MFLCFKMFLTSFSSFIQAHTNKRYDLSIAKKRLATMLNRALQFQVLFPYNLKRIAYVDKSNILMYGNIIDSSC